VLKYVARRLATTVPTLLGVATIVFLLVRLLPGDPARVIAGVNASAEDVTRIRHLLELDQPVLQQYLNFMARMVHADLGTSTKTGDPVVRDILAAAPYTLELAIISTLIATVAGITLGVLASIRHNTWIDVAISAVSVFGISMPTYWLGLILILIFAVNLHLLPAAGAGETLGFLLPSITLASFSVALIARMTRSAMLEVLRQDYVRTAWAKGMAARSVLLGHALRNALLPVITAVGLQFGNLLGGAVLTETVFSWPGIGRLIVDSIFSRDYPVVQGAILVFSAAFILVNLLVDLTYAYVDPRIRYS
jgi:peptide/nickel transport system permease protein/oligopeptide transport system permease protein